MKIAKSCEAVGNFHFQLKHYAEAEVFLERTLHAYELVYSEINQRILDVQLKLAQA